ncbi:dethiobiotin synthase [Pirellulaceae bacterium SH467]
MVAQSLFVTGTDTDVGKTYVGCLLLEHLMNASVKARAYKPVASGFAEASGSDGSRLWNATGRQGDFESVSPQRFAAPFAPTVAAAMEGKAVDEARILTGWREQTERCDFLLVEGAGGLFSPVSNRYTNADLIRLFQSRAMLVAGWKLGLVHQVVCCLVAARSIGIRFERIVLSEAVPQSDAAAASHLGLLYESLAQDPEWSSIPITEIRHGTNAWPAEDAVPC